MAHIFVSEIDPLGRLVCVGARLFQVFALCSNAQHPTAICHDITVCIELRACMEYIVTVRVFEFLQTVNLETLFIFHRITIRRQNNTDCRIVLKFQLDLIQGSVDTCLKDFHDVVLHARQDNLCLRIAETRIVFQHLRTIFGQHQTEENDTLEGTFFLLHRVNRRLIDVLFAEFVYFFCVERAWREGSHTACI